MIVRWLSKPHLQRNACRSIAAYRFLIALFDFMFSSIPNYIVVIEKCLECFVCLCVPMGQVKA